MADDSIHETAPPNLVTDWITNGDPFGDEDDLVATA